MTIEIKHFHQLDSILYITLKVEIIQYNSNAYVSFYLYANLMDLIYTSAFNRAIYETTALFNT